MNGLFRAVSVALLICAVVCTGIPAQAAPLAGSAPPQSPGANTPAVWVQPDVVWRKEGRRAQVALQSGQLVKAEASLKAALAAADLASGSLALPEAEVDRSSSVAIPRAANPSAPITKVLLNRQLLGILRDKRDYDDLFEYAERGRARQFVDLLTHSELALTDQGATNYLIRGIDAQVRQLRLQRALSPENTAAVDQELGQLMQQREQVVQDLASKNTEWAAAYAVIYSPLSKVQKALGPGVGLVYAFDTTGTRDIEYLYITSDRVSAHRIANGQKRLLQQIMNFTDAVALGDANSQRRVLKQMSRLLETESWTASQALYIVPTQALHSVPWSGLETRTWVSTLANGSWLLRNKPAALPNEAHRVLGDPEYFGQLAPLPGARGEATEIAQVYSTQAVLGAQASEQALRAENNKAWSVLHLATHGVYNKAEPLKSALFFSDGKGAISTLTASDLLVKPVRARLIVLSACESGIGQVQSDNDILGLPRSFFISGAHSVLSSLWPVSDQATSQLMKDFHLNSELGAGPALGMAVSKAKQQGLPASVYAAFVLNGYVAP